MIIWELTLWSFVQDDILKCISRNCGGPELRRRVAYLRESSATSVGEDMIHFFHAYRSFLSDDNRNRLTATVSFIDRTTLVAILSFFNDCDLFHDACILGRFDG